MDPNGRDQKHTDLDRLIRTVTEEFSPDHPELPDAFFPAHLPGALIEAVFATRPAEPQAGQGASAAFCRHFDVECHRADRWRTPARADQYTISRFILDCRSLEFEAMERAVFGAAVDVPRDGPLARASSCATLPRPCAMPGSRCCRTCGTARRSSSRRCWGRWAMDRSSCAGS